MLLSSIFTSKKANLPGAGEALPGRTAPIPATAPHRVLKVPLTPPYPAGMEQIVLGLGCFWGAERLFWKQSGVYVTAVGYAGGMTPNPTYEEVCSGRTGHTEVVLVVFDPAKLPLDKVLTLFWEAHDPTQGMRQGNDVGTQYRSAIYWNSEAQRDAVLNSAERYDAALKARGMGGVTTELGEAGPFYFAEAYHQQYLDRVPHGYCNLKGTGVACPV